MLFLPVSVRASEKQPERGREGDALRATDPDRMDDREQEQEQEQEERGGGESESVARASVR